MEIYDKNKIGKLISWGGEHVVYEYGVDKVIKFSALFFLLGKGAEEKALNDCEICKKFFGNYILNTDLYLSKNGKTIVQIQEKIQGHYLDKKDLLNSSVSKQYSEIIAGYKSLVSAGNFEIDLIGRMGVWRRCLSNVFVTKDNRLIIIDATLLGVKSKCKFPFLVSILRKLVLLRQNSTLAKFNNIVNK